MSQDLFYDVLLLSLSFTSLSHSAHHQENLETCYVSVLVRHDDWCRKKPKLFSRLTSRYLSLSITTKNNRSRQYTWDFEKCVSHLRNKSSKKKEENYTSEGDNPCFLCTLFVTCFLCTRFVTRLCGDPFRFHGMDPKTQQTGPRWIRVTDSNHHLKVFETTYLTQYWPSHLVLSRTIVQVVWCYHTTSTEVRRQQLPPS